MLIPISAPGLRNVGDVSMYVASVRIADAYYTVGQQKRALFKSQ